LVGHFAEHVHRIGGGGNVSPEGNAINSVRRVDGKKTAKFLLGISAIIVFVLAFSYVHFSMGGVLGRDVSSVVGTEWMSWEIGTLSFDEETVTHNNKGDERTFPYKEDNGSVVVDGTENPYMILCRLDGNKLITSNGKYLFYLKGSLPYSTSSAAEESE